MTGIRPFPALVVRAEAASRVVSPMPEPLEEPAARQMRDPVDPTAYDPAAAALYVYRQGDEDSGHTGLVCEVAMSAFADGRVRGHEAVQGPRVEALLRHQARAADPPALVSLLHRPGAAFARTVGEACRTRPILDLPGPGCRQTVWRVPEGPDAGAVTEELAGARLYIADGHHRVAAALEEWRLAGRPPDAGLLCVVHPIDGLRLSAFHRRVTGPVAGADLLAQLGPGLRVRALDRCPTPTVGSFGLYVEGGWSVVTHRPGPGDGPAELDVAVLQERILDRLDLLTPGRSHSVEIAPARTSVDELMERCDVDGGALFTLAPPPLEALTAVADAGQVLPPKTTCFEPKPCTGIFLRSPDGG